jgi:hypothetical protein
MPLQEATALPLRFANDFVDSATRGVTTVGHVTKYRHKKLSATKRHTRHKTLIEQKIILCFVCLFVAMI